MPKVSVIIPVYNVENYLRQCLDSVVDQTLREIEIICIDDGSVDGSGVILERYARKDSRIKIITQKNLGAGVARNEGLKFATGEWLLFLDADDILEDTCLEVACVDGMRENVDFVVFRAYELDALSHKRSPLSYLNRILPFADGKAHLVDELGNQRFTTFGLAPWNKLIRRSVVIKNNLLFQSIRRSNDLAFSVELLAKARNFWALDRLFVSYRVNNPTSLQSTNSETPTCFYDALRDAGCRLGGMYNLAFNELVCETTRYNLHSVRTFDAYRMLANYLEKNMEADFGIKIHISKFKSLNKFCFKCIRMLETLHDRGFLFCFKRLVGKVLS